MIMIAATLLQLLIRNGAGRGPPFHPRPVPAGCTTVGELCVMPYPGNEWQHPKIHQSPDCLHVGGWHDIAAALTFRGEHHVFQGCPASQGWSHSVSSDLVHWEDRGRGLHAIDEAYEGMNSSAHSYNSPCSGFVTVDDEGTPCAGFRQCTSTKGVTGLNPNAQSWDVPMELRCAKNSNLTAWGDPTFIYPAYYYRGLPYDPPRPWKDADGRWYSSFSSDGCNGTNQWGATPVANLKKVPCAMGGQLELLVSDGDVTSKKWKQLPPLFTTNVTKSGALAKPGAIQAEFVTSGYFGGLPGDPDSGKTRVVTQNNGGATFWVGKQEPGGQFTAHWDKVGAVGHYDYGVLTMARTLGSDPNQVAKNGRRVLVGWIQDDPRDQDVAASQSLARDLTLSAGYELLQQFVPELQMLRQPTTFEQTAVAAGDGSSSVTTHSAGSMQLEIVATFTFTTMPTAPFGITALGGAAEIMVDCANKTIRNMGEAPAGCMVDANIQYNSNKAVPGPQPGPVLPIGTKLVKMHIIVDHEIIESIINNRTAIVSYHKNIPSATSTAVTVVGAGSSSGVTGLVKSWHLDAANNARPQP